MSLQVIHRYSQPPIVDPATQQLVRTLSYEEHAKISDLFYEMVRIKEPIFALPIIACAWGLCRHQMDSGCRTWT